MENTASNTGKFSDMPRDEYLKKMERQGFEGFRALAEAGNLSRYERIGFPDSYRKDYEKAIFNDIVGKLARMNTSKGLNVLDIGAGCSDLPHMLIELCENQGHQLLLIDSPEMLQHLPDLPFIEKHPGYFPDDHETILQAYAGTIDCILVYSVIHYVFIEGNIFNFLDRMLGLLRSQGCLLIGDIPNISKRKRFFASETGRVFHKQFMQTDDEPQVEFNSLEPEQIDDAIIASLMLRARNAGYDSYVLPQPSNLPMANRREDILICKP